MEQKKAGKLEWVLENDRMVRKVIQVQVEANEEKANEKKPTIEKGQKVKNANKRRR